MEFAVEPEDFSGATLVVRTGGLLGGPVLLVNGQPATKGPKGGQFLVPQGTGPAAVAHLRGSQWLVDPMPRLTLDGAPMRLGAPLPWYMLAWAALPLLLIGVGGAIGAVVGVIAAVTNGRIFRSSSQPAVAFGLTLGVSLAAFAVYLAIAGAVGVGLRSAF